MNIIELAMRYKRVTLAIFSIFVVAGIFSLLIMERSEDPNIPIKQGLVIAALPGTTTTEMEEQVTKKLEEYLFSFKEIRKGKTFSTTKPGEVIIQVELENWFSPEEKDVFWSKLQVGLVSFALQELPQGTLGPIVEGDFGETTALMLGVSSTERTYQELEDYIDLLDDNLKTIPEVSKLKQYGLQSEQLTVTLNSQKLAQYGIAPQQIIQAIQTHNSTVNNGELELQGNNVNVFVDNRFTSVESLGDQIIYYHPNGGLTRLKEVAEIKRENADLTQSIEINGVRSLMLAIEMQPGNNVVKFGELLEEKIDQVVDSHFPADVKVTQIYSQPHSVDHAISHFMKEFAIAIGAVILVVMILLPMRMATISAIASPVSILITLAFMQLLGMGLNSVTLAAMIVVLGMVVDDAIIIVDNYVEKLDEGMSNWEAAWKSASQLFIPIMTATLTIIFAFLPLAFVLEGISSDFIEFMPYTVAIALSTSFIVAIFLTPFLCFVFIKKGLNSTKNKEEAKRISFLDKVQQGFNYLVELGFKRSKLLIAFGVIVIAAGVFQMTRVPQEFFPKLDRSTFNLEVWLPEGSSYEMTRDAVHQVYDHISEDDRIKDISSFIGLSSPRFFVTYAPEFPSENYAQIFINAHSPEEAGELIEEYEQSIEDLLPEGKVRIKQLSYQSSKTPLEVRLIGEQTEDLRIASQKIIALIKQEPGMAWVHTNFKNPYYAVKVNVDEEQANRLGISPGSLAQTLGAGVSGVPVSSYWEEDESLDIVLRLNEKQREGFDDVLNLYITGQSGVKVPLRQIASLQQVWEPGVIVRRNGLKTLTIRAETKKGYYASNTLKSITPQLESMELPEGVRLALGGDYESSLENLPDMMISLLVSILLIFITLLFQFKSLTKTFIILTTFPLSLFGGASGLLLTGSPFGFTAFIGLISLIGIVVRNGIVLVDFADELVRDHGYGIREAAIAAAKRRMRPIFLTSSAAAIGVLPMIIGKSPLWAPMASVLSVGLMFSMLMTLFIVPIMYAMFVKEQVATVQQQQPELALT